MILPCLLSGRTTRLRGALVALALLSHTAPAHAIKILIKGSTSLEGQVQEDSGSQLIRGKLRDDLGGPIAGATVMIELIQSNGEALRLLQGPRSCNGGGPLARMDGGYAVETDKQGAFCMQTHRLPRQGLLRARFPGKQGLTGAQIDLPFDVGRPAALLAWDPKPELLDLDAAVTSVNVALTGNSIYGNSIQLELRDERGKELGSASTDERGRARFEVETARLGAPGAGELVVRGKGEGAPELRAQVVRSARVSLVAKGPEGAIVPQDGYRLPVVVGTQRGAVDGGVVEARLGKEILGVGSVKEGRTEVPLAFEVQSEGEVELSLRYLPSSPGWKSGETLVVRVPVRPPSPLRKAPLLLVGLLLVGWLARGWKRAPSARRAEPEKQQVGGEAVALPELSVEEVQAGTRWEGRVLDAHERRPLVGVEVRVVGRDFYGERRLVEARTDEQGRFDFEVEWAPTHVLQVSGPWHVMVERSLPRAGKMTVGLVSRRRALLEKLATAGRRWVPEQAVEPTPEQLARHLERQERAGGARWARAVEAAVFGRDPVGAGEEARLSELESDLSRRDQIDGVRR
jgi:hypothetical protein